MVRRPLQHRSALPIQTALPVAGAFRPEYLSYYRILPLAVEDGRLRVAVAGAPNPDALDDLRQSYGLDLALEPVDEGELQDAIRRTFAAAESVVELVRDLDAALGPGELDTSEGLADVRDLANQPPVIRYVNLLIRDAHAARASDIHLEAAPEGLRVRLRIDGVLTELQGPPRGYQAAVVSRVKLLAELDIAERRAPQDGRIRVRLEARELDLRISTVPTLHGESVVLRLLDRGGQAVGLGDLGMATDILDTFRRLATRPHGIILATGPTGSGKTTTLYAALALRDGSREKVVTVEDPVEYHLPGVTQVDWAIHYGRQYFAIAGAFLRLEAVKFQRVIQPGRPVRLELDWRAEKHSLAFKLVSDVGQHASGRVVFEI